MRPVCGRRTLQTALAVAAMISLAVDARASTPVVRYSTYWGGSDFESTGNNIGLAADPSGNVFVSTISRSPNFPLVNPFRPAPDHAGSDRPFLLKLSPTGTVVFSTFFPGGGGPVAADRQGNVYVAGFVTSGALSTVNAAQPAFGGDMDGFIVKVSPARTILYSTYLGGSGRDFVTDLAVDTAGNLYVTGTTTSTDFPLANASRTSGRSFLTRIAPDGRTFTLSTYVSGTDALAVAVDPAGTAYLTGRSQCDLDVVHAFQPTCGGPATDFSGDAFVTKVAPDGRVVYSTYLGGSGGELGRDIAVDALGQAHVVGRGGSPDFPLVNPFQPVPRGGSESFVAKLSADGSQLVYSTFLGGRGNDVEGGIALDGAGGVYVSGFTPSVDFPSKDAVQPALKGSDDGYLTRFAADGTLVSSTFLGGTRSDGARMVAVDDSGDVTITGFVSSLDFPVVKPAQATSGGPYDIFVAKMGAPVPAAMRLAPVADAYVRDGGSAGANFGTDPSLIVKASSGTGNNRISYLRFPLAGLPATVGTARLRIFGSRPATSSVTDSAFAVASNTWSETAVTWNNRPALGAKQGAGVVITPTPGTYEWDVTSFVRAQQAAGAPAVSLAVKMDTLVTASPDTFQSREAAEDHPELLVTFTSATPPPTVTLDALADGYVRDGTSAATSFGTATALAVKTTMSAGNNRVAYVRFPLNGVGSHVTSARLRLFGSRTTASPAADSAFAVADNNWTEAGLTWNSRPPLGARQGAVTITTAAQYYEWDVTTFVAAQRSAGVSEVSLAVSMETAVDHGPDSFSSREAAANRPQLVIISTP